MKPEAEAAVQGPEPHERDRGRAVRIGDDPLVAPQSLGIDLGNHKRDVGIHPERRTLVDDEASRLHCVGRQRTGDRTARGEERNVDIGKHAGLGLLDDPFFGP
jgi:hypothetical protein